MKDSETKLEPMIKDRITHIILISWQNEDTRTKQFMIDSFLKTIHHNPNMNLDRVHHEIGFVEP